MHFVPIEKHYSAVSIHSCFELLISPMFFFMTWGYMGLHGVPGGSSVSPLRILLCQSCLSGILWGDKQQIVCKECEMYIIYSLLQNPPYVKVLLDQRLKVKFRRAERTDVQNVH